MLLLKIKPQYLNLYITAMWGPLEIKVMLCTSVVADRSPSMLSHRRIPFPYGLMAPLSFFSFSFLFAGCTSEVAMTPVFYRHLLHTVHLYTWQHNWLPQSDPPTDSKTWSLVHLQTTSSFTAAPSNLLLHRKRDHSQRVRHTILKEVVKKDGMNCIFGDVIPP